MCTYFKWTSMAYTQAARSWLFISIAGWTSSLKFVLFTYCSHLSLKSRESVPLNLSNLLEYSGCEDSIKICVSLEYFNYNNKIPLKISPIITLTLIFYREEYSSRVVDIYVFIISFGWEHSGRDEVPGACMLLCYSVTLLLLAPQDGRVLTDTPASTWYRSTRLPRVHLAHLTIKSNTKQHLNTTKNINITYTREHEREHMSSK